VRDVQGPGGASLSRDRRRRPLVLGLLALAVVVLVVDQLTKVWAEQTFTEGERTPVLGDLLGLTLLHNSGAALSLASGMTWVFTVAAVVVSVVVLRVAHRLGSLGWSVALGLLLGGALGNLADRLFRPPAFGRGHVVDFIAYGNLFVGNVADIAIVAAAGLIVLLSLRGIGLDGSRGDHDGEPSGADPDDDADAGLRSDGPADGEPLNDISTGRIDGPPRHA
jgi:signal peptidase II